MDKRIVGEILYSFGLTKKPHLDQQFDYQERSKLTVPPDQGLPKPQAPDPAVARRQEKPKPNWRAHDPDEFTNPILPSQLRANTAAAATANGSSSSFDPPDPMRPSQLGSSGGLFGFFTGGKGNEQREQTAAVPAGEPPRRALTDPPPGYQTPSPDHPYGGAVRASSKPKADHALGDDEGL